MKLDQIVKLSEMYTAANSSLLSHFRNGGKIDYDLVYDTLAYQLVDWLDHYGHEPTDVFDVDIIERLLPSVDWTDGQDVAEAIQQLDEPEMMQLFGSMDDSEQESLVTYAVDRTEETEKPAWSAMSLNKEKLLPRQTWLLHFSDDAGDIWCNGFKYGFQNFNGLGLTTFHHDRKRDEGYNFAFRADDSRSYFEAVHRRKYGRDLVMFQSAGVEAYHYGDEENQVMFYGRDLNPSTFVYITLDDNEGWVVQGNSKWRGEHRDNGVFRAEKLDVVIDWVKKNYRQYQNVLTSR